MNYETYLLCRYLAKDKKNGMHQLSKKLMRRLGVLGKTEDFDSEQLKSKLIFFSIQGVYSVLVCIPTKWLYSSYPLSVLYIAFIYLWCIWRGGTYYIEVKFRVKVTKQLAIPDNHFCRSSVSDTK